MTFDVYPTSFRHEPRSVEPKPPSALMGIISNPAGRRFDKVAGAEMRESENSCQISFVIESAISEMLGTVTAWAPLTHPFLDDFKPHSLLLFAEPSFSGSAPSHSAFRPLNPDPLQRFLLRSKKTSLRRGNKPPAPFVGPAQNPNWPHVAPGSTLISQKPSDSRLSAIISA